SSYTISRAGLTTIVSGPDGTDTLLSVEMLQFADGSISLAAKNDFNDDLRSDVLIQSGAGGSQAGTPQIWIMSGTSVVSRSVLSNPGANWIIAGTGDFNRDAATDILWRNTLTGDVRLWEMNGTSVALDATVASGLPADWVIAGVGDFDGDSKADILWRNITTGD